MHEQRQRALQVKGLLHTQTPLFLRKVKMEEESFQNFQNLTLYDKGAAFKLFSS